MLKQALATLVVVATVGTPFASSEPTVVERLLFPHLPIVIDGDSGWTAANGVVRGTGTAFDPFVIANWLIVSPGSHGIRIYNTSAHAEVRDNAILAAYGDFVSPFLHTAAILASNVSNLRIIGNQLDVDHSGIQVNRYSQLEVRGNVVRGAAPDLAHGIGAYNGEAAAVSDNSISGVLSGITVQSSQDVAVTQNHLEYVAGPAVSISDSAGILLVDNKVTRCLTGGVLWHVSFSTVESNTFHHCKTGFYWDVIAAPHDGVGNVLRGNHVVGGELGLDLGRCTNCSVTGNKVVGSELCLWHFGSAPIERNSFTGCAEAVRVSSVTEGLFRENAFLGNAYNITATNAGVDARWNWWSDAAGPDPGSFAGPVVYGPWLEAAPSG